MFYVLCFLFFNVLKKFMIMAGHFNQTHAYRHLKSNMQSVRSWSLINENDVFFRLHRMLVRGFLRSAIDMLTENGEIHITHKTAYPYTKWEIVELAEEIGLCLLKKVRFHSWYYPGYINRRGSGTQINETFPVGECSTFKFAKSW